jgi:hypothetical protein
MSCAQAVTSKATHDHLMAHRLRAVVHDGRVDDAVQVTMACMVMGVGRVVQVVMSHPRCP